MAKGLPQKMLSLVLYIWTFTGPVETSLTGDPEAIIPLTLTQEMIQSMGAGHLLIILVSQ